jgi:hypothetical protein
MWREDPEQLLKMVNQREVQLRAEAAANRAARRGARRTPDLNRVSGLQIHLGSVLIVVGRTFCDDRSSPNPVRS